MVLGIVRDAIHLKLKAREESPLISVYEFCYAAGLGLRIMEIQWETAEKIRDTEDFISVKNKVQEMVKDSQAFENYPNGLRLKNLIAGCRIGGQMSEEARLLFDMGFSGE
ncbi:MAG: DUF3837 family protein [Eubacteriales bacterium]|nr:DUF3837 family protein [Eubacteriales bacterium]